MGILGANGKSAGAGLPCLYSLISGQIFYSECAKDDGEAYLFDGDKTVIVNVKPGKGQVELQMQKLSEAGFKSKYNRVMKSFVQLVQDCGEPGIVSKCHEAMSGLTLPPGSN
jgi:hypothetical protein